MGSLGSPEAWHRGIYEGVTKSPVVAKVSLSVWPEMATEGSGDRSYLVAGLSECLPDFLAGLAVFRVVVVVIAFGVLCRASGGPSVVSVRHLRGRVVTQSESSCWYAETLWFKLGVCVLPPAPTGYLGPKTRIPSSSHSSLFVGAGLSWVTIL